MSNETFPFPRLIAEIGSNHEGDFDYACRLLSQAARCGADAVKFQTYSADLIANPVIAEQRNKHFSRLSLSAEQFEALAALSEEHGTQFMSSLWDEEAVRRLDTRIRVHKVGSGDITNFPLLRTIVQTGKPVILSTAMSSLEEIREVVRFVLSVDPEIVAKGYLAVLHCVAMYGDPKDEFANLDAIRVLQDAFPDVTIGYSDHTVGMYACELAVAMGARIIEKHFTDDTTRSFRDHAISATESDFRSFRSAWVRISSLVGSYSKNPISGIETEQRISEFRRAVFPARDLSPGTVIAGDDVVTLRPLVGIDARQFDQVVGRRLRVSKKRYEQLSWDDFE